MPLIKFTARNIRVYRLLSNNVSVDSRPKEVQKDGQIPQFLSNAEILENKKVPIEKKSVSRGLILNRFEKDFMIYPELLDMRSVENIKSYCEHLNYRLEVALGSSDPGSKVNQVLLENFVFAAYIKKDLGGMEMKRRELLCINETIAKQDLSTFCNVSSVQLATILIQNFGNAEQVNRLIPKIGTGQIRVAISLEDMTETLNLEANEINGKVRLNGKLKDVMNAADADVLVVFAKDGTRDDEDSVNCYVIDKDNIKGKIFSEAPKPVMGLEGVKFSTVHFNNVEVSAADRLENNLSGPHIFHYLQEMNRALTASGAIGALKRVLADLSIQANRTIVGRNRTLSELPAVKTIINNIAREIYNIESVLYYFSGLSDEDLFVINDVESMVVEKLTRRALQNTILGVSEVIGLASVDSKLPLERWIRDLSTFFCTLTNESKLSEKISSLIIGCLADENQHWRPSLWRLAFPAPKPTSTSPLPMQANKHFIAEHLHISLKKAAFAFEAGLGQVDEALFKTIGKNKWKIPEEKKEVIEETIAEMALDQVLLAALLSRTSRSYSIGLKNADVEYQWTFEYGLKFDSNITKNVRDLWHVWNMKDYKKLTLPMKYPFQMPLAVEPRATIG